MTVEPAFEALRHRINTKIFQEKTAPEILEEVLNEGLGAYGRSVDNRLARAYPTCEYRTQYHESDLAFCERLMEEEGIVYWFEFEGEAETLVLADDSSKFGKVQTIHGPQLTYARQEGQVGGHEYVSELHALSRVVPTKVATRHFDWTHPSMPVEGESDATADGDRPDGAALDPEREVYEHDGKPLTINEYDGAVYGKTDVEDQAKLRREAQAWNAFVCEGKSTVLGVTVASTFELVGHPRFDLDGVYAVVSAIHRIVAEKGSYRNVFECIPSAVTYRPKRTTRRPTVSGIQTATVVGPSGEEIHTDEHGRIKVQFHWDRVGSLDESSSCWVRVQQPWAGAGWGFVFIPRMGMEVIVDFVSGDPDRPVVIGSVYNGDHAPPYPLPDEKTKSTIKTESSLGGGGYNELRFEDKAGSEEIFTHAQKDQNEVVENDHTTTVGNNQTNTVGVDQNQDIGSNQTEHVGANQEMTVDGNRTTHTKGDFSETVDGAETRVVSGGVTETIDASETRTISGGMTETITGDRTQSISGSSTESITGSLAQEITGGATITTSGTYDVTAAGEFKITAAGGSKINATGGITIIAPGGLTTHDSIWTEMGGTWTDTYGFCFNLTLAFKMDNCYGLALLANGATVERKILELTAGIVDAGAFIDKDIKEGANVLMSTVDAAADGVDTED
jgi:type VI secretion system secreted protein VgrG